MAAEPRPVPPMSFVAQMLRDDGRLAELRDERNQRKPLFSSTAIAVVLMLASRVNRKSLTAWPSLTTLARDCALNERSIRRCERAISVFFYIEEDEGRHNTYVFKSPDDYDADLESLMSDGNADHGSTTPDHGSKTPDPRSTKRTVGPKKRTHGPPNSKREPVIEPVNEPENRTLPRRGSADTGTVEKRKTP